MRLTLLATVVVLTGFYAVAANEHGRRVNVSKARGDQSGYLGDAERVHALWTKPVNQPPIGDRNRMPLYPTYLAAFYYNGLSDPDFFEIGKRASIGLSLALLALLAIVLRRNLPAHAAANLLLIVAFGYFVFKAAYTQADLLFYTLFFLTFLSVWHLLRSRRTRSTLALAVLAGALAALSNLTKAAVPPLVVLTVVVLVAEPLLCAMGGLRPSAGQRLGTRALAAMLFVTTFLAVLSPYLATNKRVYGRYFYNINSTFYVWYDSWAAAAVDRDRLGDGKHWPLVPDSELPSAGRYLRDHSVGQIAGRIRDGLVDMASVSYRSYNIWQYALLLAAGLGIVAIARGQVLLDMARDHLPLTVFVAAYVALYVVATAFYYPISGTGTARFLLAHVLPIFFVAFRILTSSRLREATRSGTPPMIATENFQLVITAVLAIDLAFHVWPRLMSTYGGF